MNLNHEYPRVLTIAGSDSGGGAGVQADLKTFAALGCYGLSAITALTAQNTLGVSAIHAPPADFLAAQLDAVLTDIGAHAIKIGMLHAPDIIATVACALQRHSARHVVLDPVMVATSGARLIREDALDALRQALFPRACVITPNLHEAAWLLGRDINSAGDLHRAAEDLIAQGARSVLIKGGHLPGERLTDLWLSADGQTRSWCAPRIATPNTHGTGCTLSSAIAAHLALGLPLVEALDAAHVYVRQALHAGAGVRTGASSGPLNHQFAPQPMCLRALPPSGPQPSSPTRLPPHTPDTTPSFESPNQ